MIAVCNSLQLFIGLGETSAFHMAVAASKIQADLRESCCAVFAELVNLIRVNRHKMGANVTSKRGRVTPGRFDNARHMALDTGYVHGDVLAIVLELGLLEVAILALGARGRFAALSQF